MKVLCPGLHLASVILFLFFDFQYLCNLADCFAILWSFVATMAFQFDLKHALLDILFNSEFSSYAMLLIFMASLD